jgi:antitoxin Phd
MVHETRRPRELVSPSGCSRALGLVSSSYDSYAVVVTAPEELPISDVRDHFADVLGRATYAGQITYITKRGQRVGAVVPVEVAEAAEAAEDAYLLRLAREAEEELDAGASTRPLLDVADELDILPPPVPGQRSGRGARPLGRRERNSRPIGSTTADDAERRERQ